MDVIAVRVANDLEKQSLLSLDPDRIFTEPHYDGDPAVLVRLSTIDDDSSRTSSPMRGDARLRSRLAAELEASHQATPGD